jgi:uncharacterized protein YcaQ
LPLPLSRRPAILTDAQSSQQGMSVIANAARIALAEQGLLRGGAFGSGHDGAMRALEALGFVQIDTISVVARAHHHTLWSRVPGFRPEHLDRLVGERRAFEYWAHAAAYLPMSHYRFALPRMNALRAGERHWIRHPDFALMRAVVDRIRDEGPLRVRDFEQAAAGGPSGWWQWKPAKRALEQLYIQGDLMVSARDGMEKIYDLPERVLPPDIDTREPSTAEWADHLIDTTLAAHGFASSATFTYQRRNERLRKTVRERLHERLASGRLVRTVLTDGTVVYTTPTVLETRSRRPPPRVKLLSPFDNAIIERARTRSVHGYDYRIECYVPAAKRRFGYYCLPILYRDTFIGRLDAKADRPRSELVIKHLYIERPTAIDAGGERDAFLAALASTLADYARFVGCTEIRVERVTPRRFRADVVRAL